MKLHNLLCLTALATATLTAYADGKPTFIDPIPGGQSYFNKMSDNGRWTVAPVPVGEDGTILNAGALLVDLTDTSKRYMISHESGFADIADVTDDGNILVGSANEKPAYYNRETGAWTTLSLPRGYSTGYLTAVTPDGKFAVGNAGKGDIMQFWPLAYDLTTGEQVVFEGLPYQDMTNQNQNQNRFIAISPDARYIIGELSYSYIGDSAIYIYDRETATFKMLGFDHNNFQKAWTPWAEDLFFIDNASMSASGEWLTGSAYCVHPVAGSEFGNEYQCAYRYNILTGAFDLYNAEADRDYAGFSIDNAGTIYAASPAENPYSEGFVRSGKYFYRIIDVLAQTYGTDYNAESGFSNAGKPYLVTGDGLTIGLIPNTTSTYFLKLSEPLANLCGNVDLLKNYTATPAPGAKFSRITNVKLTFDRNIEVNGNANKILLLDQDGKQVRTALNASVENATVTIGFRGTNLDKDKTYEVVIPAGLINVAGDREMANKEIRIKYEGRGSDPVALVQAYPADGAEFAILDASQNPLQLTFDADVTVADGALAYLYRPEEGNDLLVSNIVLAAQGRQVMAAPVTGQYLYKGESYKVVIPENSILDLTGSGGNAEITLNYKGTYEKLPDGNSRYYFTSNCDNFTDWLFYEGDHNTPQAAIADMGFTADGSPWWVVRDSNTSTDMALASHSMYTPAGKADDWMVIPQIKLTDDKAVLAFDAQGFKKNKQDRLKIIVLPSDDRINLLYARDIAKFRAEGEVIFDEVLSPGKSEDLLEGDWTNYSLPLAKWAGKNVYIAFVNENEDQSMVIIDNVRISRGTPYIYSFTTPDRVVARDSQKVEGMLQILETAEPYTTVNMTLKDSEGNAVSNIKEEGLSLKENDKYEFSFPEGLPLTLGRENDFTVEISLDDVSTAISSSITNLAFMPIQRVVLEEYSGRTCGNCPMGFMAAENLEKTYGEQFIPIVLRTFQGDPQGNGVMNYSDFLGFGAAPTGMINRGGITNPFISADGKYYFSGEGFVMSDGSDNRVWLDFVREEFANLTDLDISLNTTYDESTNHVTATATIRSAVDAENQNISLFAVYTENDVISTFQENYFSESEDPNCGPWGKGGELGSKRPKNVAIQNVARGTIGATFNGTGGLLPSKLNAGEEYTAELSGTLPGTVDNTDKCYLTVMMIDANTGRVINADRAKLGGNSAVEGIGGDDDLTISSLGTQITATGQGEIILNVYDLSGRVIASVIGNGTATADLAGLSGVAIVRAQSATATKTAKVALR